MKEFYSFLHTLAERSGEVILPHYLQRGLQVDRKSDDSPVTIADRRAEEVMREVISKRYPDHGIIGEEYGRERENAEFVWVLDPIDGTISFTHGCPLWGTLIALLRNGAPVLGAIHQPALKQLCIGDGATTVLNSEPIRLRPCADLSNATLLATDIALIGRHQSAERFAALQQKVRLFRTWGDCYGYLLLAGGGGDIMLDPIMNLWDVAALVPIIRGAGGEVTGWKGGSAVEECSCVAAASTIHGEVLRILNGTL